MRTNTRKSKKVSKEETQIKQLEKKLSHLSSGKAIVAGGRGLTPMRPPAFVSVNVATVKRRLKFSTALTNFNPSIQALFNVLGGVSVSTTLWVPSWWAFRILKIEMWSAVVSVGTPVTASLQDVSIDSAENDFNGVPIQIVDESISIDYPAHVKLRPNITTPLGSWHNGSANVAVLTFDATCSANTIMDITYEAVLPYDFVPNTYTRVVSGGTVGQFSCIGFSSGIVDGVTNF